MNTGALPTGFVAYPSNPPSLTETIETAIDAINQSGRVRLSSWKEMSVGGKPIISAICAKIEESSLFVADITDHNANVLFELGYAMARKKRVWLLHDSSTQAACDRLRRVSLLDPIGYIPYTNSDQIVAAFLGEECPLNDLHNTAYALLVQPIVDAALHTGDVLYLKCYTSTEAANRLTRTLNKTGLSTIAFDPSEKSPEPIDWYIKHVCGTGAVVAHLDRDSVDNASPTNARYAFVAGFAYGLEKDILLLAHDPYESPLDYKRLLRIHTTAQKCVDYAEEWLREIRDRIRLHEREAADYRATLSKRRVLASLRLGEHVAEYERETLPEYFVETGPFHEALHAKLCLFVGRKGTGKTANLYRVAQVKASDKRVHVCVVKPYSYDTEAVLSRIKKIKDKAEMGGVYESLWKYLVYSELCLSIYEALQERYSGTHAAAEEKFVKFYEESPLVDAGDFSVRMQTRLELIEADVLKQWDGSNRVRLAEHLHSGIISQMRQYLGLVLAAKDQVVVLIDNLDKAWRTREDIGDLCDLLLGLLGVMSGISADFGKQEHWRERISLSLVAFLRSDIYAQLRLRAREPDKIKTVRILWDDRALLLRVIAERFIYTNENLTEEAVWRTLFPKEVAGIPTKDYIVGSIYPRPRDAVFFASKALSLAVSRGHDSISAEDLSEAHRSYSEYAFDSLNAEDANGLGTIERGTYALIGKGEILTEQAVNEALRTEGVSEAERKAMIKALCRLSVLGVETQPNNFTFIYDDTQLDRELQIANAYSIATGVRRYRVHPALHPALGIQGEMPSS